LALMPDGRIVVGGNSSEYYYLSAARLRSDGSFDVSFGNAGRVILKPYQNYYFGGARYVLVQPDGKVLLAGNGYNLVDQSEFGYSGHDCAIWRLTADGKPDATFGTNGQAAFSQVSTYLTEIAGSIALRPDGKIVFGTTYDEDTVSILLLNRDGSLAADYEPIVDQIAYPSVETTIVLPDGGILVTGYELTTGFAGEYEDDPFTFADGYMARNAADNLCQSDSKFT
jgi:uncharacterized delta-60 repeat protein